MLFKAKPEEKPTKRIGRKAEKINLVNKISWIFLHGVRRRGE